MTHADLSPVTHSAADVARLLGLQPLVPEGGFFRRVAEGPADGATGRRTWSTILFLVTPAGFSALHRMKADEVWCFHSGDALESLRLGPEGGVEWVRLGLNPAAGERAQDVVRGGVWQGTRLVAGGRWALVSCVVVPEFVWEDFELGERVELAARYPAFAAAIAELTRPHGP